MFFMQEIMLGPAATKAIGITLCFVLTSAFITSKILYVTLQGGFRLVKPLRIKHYCSMKETLLPSTGPYDCTSGEAS